MSAVDGLWTILAFALLWALVELLFVARSCWRERRGGR